MIGTTTYSAVPLIFLLASSTAQAGVCTSAIAQAQSEVDAAIENSLSTDGWKPESIGAMRGYQPTPRSLAQTEGHGSAALQQALDLLGRARKYDRLGNGAACREQLTNVRSILLKRTR